MKLLLTSGGLSNPTLRQALLDLAGKPAAELKLAFVTTAMNVERGDKGWVIRQLDRFNALGLAQIDLVDVAAVTKEIWLPRLQESDVIFVNGGNTTYLMQCCNQSGLREELPQLLTSRVYVGASAGSYIMTPDLRFNTDNVKQVLDGFGLVKYGLQAHYQSPQFPVAKSREAVTERVKGCPYDVYAIDDQMAVKVDGDATVVIGEGEYLFFPAQ